MIAGSRMKIYSVYLHPKKTSPYEHAIFVPEGFNVFAFLFTGFWAASKQLWWLALLFFCLHFGSGYIGVTIGLSPISAAVLELGFRVMIGMSAYDLWRMSLERRGYVVSDVIVAYSELEATHRYLDKHLGSGASNAMIANAQPVA